MDLLYFLLNGPAMVGRGLNELVTVGQRPNGLARARQKIKYVAH